MAYGVIAGLLAAFFVAAPYADLPLQPVPAFITIYSTAVVTMDSITAALIAAQFWVTRWTWLLVLACGFFFTALMSVAFMLTYPGAFAPSGLFGAGVQTAAWISLIWNFLSPLVLVAATLMKGSRETTRTWQGAPSLAIVLSVVLVAAIVCGLTWALIAANDSLPWIYVYRVAGQNNLALFLPVVASTVIAIGLLWARARSVLDLWLLVMCCSWLFRMLLAGVLAGSRYNLGWYTGRTVDLIAVFIVLLLFLAETTALYANMARTALRRRGARQARQVAMHAMAASIGHEIRQPLTALLINASSGARQLSEAEPDFDEVRATLSDIVADGERIKGIVGGVRTMFKGSTHDRQPLDINRVVRDALAATDLELRHLRVVVQTDLTRDLPTVLGDSGQLHQVFLNLITNALEAMTAVTDRSPVLRITSGTVPGSSVVAVTVEDSGVGISAQDSNRVLEPFYSTKVEGTGVGLTICQVILKAHGGSLHVSANKPFGTIFRVTLPTDDDE